MLPIQISAIYVRNKGISRAKIEKIRAVQRFRVKSCRSISLPVKNMASGAPRGHITTGIFSTDKVHRVNVQCTWYTIHIVCMVYISCGNWYAYRVCIIHVVYKNAVFQCFTHLCTLLTIIDQVVVLLKFRHTVHFLRIREKK